jgi:hypothetical protein
MRLTRFLAPVVSIGLAAGGCATGGSAPQVDSSGLVRIDSKEPGDLFAHPSRSMDDYDNFLLGDVSVDYAPAQTPLSELDTQRLRMSTYEIVTTQIPAAGQLGVSQPGPCTVKLEVKLSKLQLPKQGSKSNGSTTVTLLFSDSLSGDPLVRYAQQRELALGAGGPNGPELMRLQSTLEIVAVDMREHFRYALPLNGTGARADRGCKGTIGAVRKAAREAHPR